MLRQDVAEARLKEIRIDQWEDKRSADFGRVPEPLRTIGRGLLNRDPKGKPHQRWTEEERKARESTDRALCKLNSQAREKLFSVLFPQLGKQMESAWKLYERLPYETGYSRRAFRAPSDPELVNTARCNWVRGICASLSGYDQNAAWLAAWAPYISGYGGSDAVGILLAGVIDAGKEEGDQVFEILCDSARNEHEIGRMGRHVSRALLVASRPDGWEFIEKMLLAAQRQEGLRQVILESIDEAHPEAFRRMLRLILDQNLVRFSSVVRAFDVWFGLQWDALTPARIKNSVSEFVHFLENNGDCKEAIRSATGETLYLALWANGFPDSPPSVKTAAALLKDADVERRFVAVRYLNSLNLPAARKALERCLEDEDLRIVLHALYPVCSPEDPQGRLFEPLKRLIDRMPETPRDLEPLVWPWTGIRADRESIGQQLVRHLGKRPHTILIPYIPILGPWGKVQLIENLARQKTWPPSVRETLFSLLRDRNNWVREKALQNLSKCDVNEEEAIHIEGLLTRKSPETRRGALGLLKKQEQDTAFASADRLLASRKAEQRLGGLELLRMLVESKKGVALARDRAGTYQEQRKILTEHEQLQLEAILDIHREVPTLENALGLMDPGERTTPPSPQKKKVTVMSQAAVELLKDLDRVVGENAEKAITIETYQGPQTVLLGTLNWNFPTPNRELSLKADLKRLPLRKVWEEWWNNRPARLRDKDGLELIRAMQWSGVHSYQLVQAKNFVKARPEFSPVIDLLVNGCEIPALKYPGIVGRVLGWFRRMETPEKLANGLLDIVETISASLPVPVKGKDKKEDGNFDWYARGFLGMWNAPLQNEWTLTGSQWTAEQKTRLFHLLQWQCLQGLPLNIDPPAFDVVQAAYEAGGATRADLFNHLLGPRVENNWGSRRFDSLAAMTLRGKTRKQSPEIREMVEQCRNRVIEVELARGEMPTAATPPAEAISSVHGLDLLLRLLPTFAKKPFDRRYYGQSRSISFSKLIAKCYPTAEDTPEEFVVRVKPMIKAGQIHPQRLVELAFWAPQWLPHVEQYLGWTGFKEGVCWFLVHSGSNRQGIVRSEDELEPRDPRRPDPWQQFIKERTTLTQEERGEGAVDVGWFRRSFDLVGARRWKDLYEACKFGCTDNGFKKAQTITNVLLGKTRRNDLIDGIRKRQLKENVRLLGLLPLARGDRREVDLQQRFKVYAEYRRYVRTLSAMSKEGAMRTLDIGLKNLAMTAGYPDPVRLEWAMEAREIADLANGPVSATVDGVTVTLALDDQAQAQVTIRRGEKELKTLPAPVRKNPRVRNITERKTELKRQASRMRQSLESMMIRGDTFTGEELEQLFAHPVLVPLLSRLVLVGEGIRGYPVKGGKGLEGINGKTEPVKKGEQLRFAHPHDLLSEGDWHDWQTHLFRTERIQPFKQIFRELYTMTAQEKKDGKVSNRYAGQQIQPTQSMALFGSRGWSTRDGVSKTFFDEGITVTVDFQSGVGTPLEVEGLTVDTVQFIRRARWEPMFLKDVPPRMFSEVMRDLDLVVSVAHVGGVDPEASASTVEMRASLLRETCSLLKINNYRLKANHALINGQLGKYSVHLGSGGVHKLPGGHVCIVPVHSQHRGRLFLPFADDDPRTAEVLSKVLLLARDHEIQDPNILDQLR